MSRPDYVAAYTPGHCAHPERCGSDGETCCHPDCSFCLNRRSMYLTSRTRKCSMCDRLAMFLSRLCRDHWLEMRDAR